ncbi:hypothetical protein LPN04_12125 [Rugamonas sp. A1-17]|nr:hypothetical protein [Rugamonas sp. A1-17]
MRNTLFASIKKTLSASTTKFPATVAKKDLSLLRPLAEIQHLTIKEYSAVAGGPEVQNDPV